jgi:hypothetical protein
MKFTEGEGVWYLIDEAAPSDACVIAVLKDDVELLALKRLCEDMLEVGASAGGSFAFLHDGKRYEVTRYADRGNRLSLKIVGDDGSLRRIESEFTFPATEL